MWPPKEHLRRAFATHSPRINNMAPEDKHGVVAVVVVVVAVLLWWWWLWLSSLSSTFVTPSLCARSPLLSAGSADIYIYIMFASD